VVRWLRFRWRVDGQALLIDQGLLQRQRRVIPFDRIQAVESVRKLRHRLFGVVELRIETVGGASTEGKLEALRPRDAEQLRRLLLRETPTTPPASQQVGEPAAVQPEQVVLARLGLDRLVIAGLTGGRVGVAAAIFGVGQDFFGDRLNDLLPRIDLSGDLRSILVLAALVLTGAFLLSIAATLLTYWNFTLTSDGVALRVRRGLLEQRADTIPLRRVQALHVEENLLRRPFGLAAVTVEVAGRSGGEEAQQSRYLLPLGTRAQALRLVEQVWGRDGLADIRLAPMPTRARDRRMLRAVGAVAAVTATGVVAQGWAGLLALALSAPAMVLALAAYRCLGHGRSGEMLVARSGVVVRRTSFVPRDRLQSLALRQSVFQRRRGLASLALQIARGRAARGDPRMIDLDERQAAGLLETLTAAR
jgi:putative membrane protein